MCGITGLLRFDQSGIDPALLGQMTAQLHHRGPDAQGAWTAAGIGLGHTRLSIIDLGSSAQPMASTDGRHQFVFNGEILNYRQLRSELDYPFTTNGDTEVLLAGLVLEGADFLRRVRGQFAFALYDTQTRSLLLGRDPVGILPLYYYRDDTQFVFGSEIKAVLPAMPSRRVDEASLDAYLTRSAVPAPHTLFAGVRKVLPGHTLTVSGPGRPRSTAYWSPPATDPDLADPAAAVDLVDAGLQAAVRAALVADVPVGAYLSGGLDSSLITALVRAAEPAATIETFSAGFGDERFDELPFARAVSEQLRTNHHEVIVNPADFTELWPKLTWHRDAPLSQPADIAVYRLAELARTRVKVVLSGEGSDELFGGYEKYRFVRAVEAARFTPGSWRAWGYEKARARLPRRVEIVARAAAGGDPQARREAWFAPFSPAERRALLAGRTDPVAAAERSLPWTFSGDAVRRQLEHDLRTWLPDNLLERGDRMSMAASLELRPPFLDRDLVDLAFRLPSSVKVPRDPRRGGSTKWIVKEVGRRYLPAQITDRPKVGFKVPLDRWFRSGLDAMARDLLLAPNSLAGAAFDQQRVRALIERHRQGGRQENRLWTLLGLEVWHQQYFG